MLDINNIINELSKDNLKLTEEQELILKDLCDFENKKCEILNVNNYRLVEDFVISALKVSIKSGNMKESIK